MDVMANDDRKVKHEVRCLERTLVPLATREKAIASSMLEGGVDRRMFIRLYNLLRRTIALTKTDS